MLVVHFHDRQGDEIDKDEAKAGILDERRKLRGQFDDAGELTFVRPNKQVLATFPRHFVRSSSFQRQRSFFDFLAFPSWAGIGFVLSVRRLSFTANHITPADNHTLLDRVERP